jgi:hypothetical protein
MNAPTLPWKPSTTPAIRPNGNWICKCGIGNHSHEHKCAECGKPYEEIPDTEDE